MNNDIITTGGVWCVYNHDNGWYIKSIHRTEVQALRQATTNQVMDRVMLIPWDSDVYSTIQNNLFLPSQDSK